MKKLLITLIASAVFALASTDATVNATMTLMDQGMQKITKGFTYNDKQEIVDGIKMIENANEIFKNVDVATFIPHNNKVQATKSISSNIDNDLKAFKQAIDEKRYSDATQQYGKVLNDCMSCHTIIRGW